MLGPLVAEVGEAALLAIGVSGAPVDPALEFEDPAFGGDDPFVIPGACQPVTLRALAILLLNTLPPVDRAALGTLLYASGGRDPENPARIPDHDEDEALRERGRRLLKTLPSRALDSYSLWPLFQLHLGSSQRTILEDVAVQVRLHQRGRTPARATRPEILDAYLEVWDQREGWTGSGYSRRATRRFVEIAGARAGRRKTSTAFDRYRRAFELIVGRPCSFGLWFGLFGFLTLNRYLGDRADDARLGVARYDRRTRADVDRPEAIAEETSPRPAGSARPGRHDGEPDLPADYRPADYRPADLGLDVEALIDAGRTDAEIAAYFGVDAVEHVAEIRRRLAEERGLAS